MGEIVRRNRAAVGFGVAAVGAAVLAVAAFPVQRELGSLLELVAKLVPFLLAAEAIARLDLDRSAARVLAPLLLLGCFGVVFTWFVPQVFFHLDRFEEVYVRMQVIVPFVILTMALAYRLGGGPATTVRRLTTGLLIVMVSGIEDLAFLTVNPHTDPAWATIPDQWTWADHMTVRLGHVPSKHEAYAFIAVHLLVALAVLLVPGTWVQRARTRLRRRSRASQHEVRA